MQYETCRHVKEDGAYCGSPALRDRKYCYYHLMQRGRRLRRARALRDNLPYRLEIQSLDNPYAIRAALTDIAQALAAGQLDSRTAGKLLYAIQQVSSTNRRIEQMEAAAVKKCKRCGAPGSRPFWAITWVHNPTPTPASRNFPNLRNNSVYRRTPISTPRPTRSCKRLMRKRNCARANPSLSLHQACALALPPTVSSARRPIRSMQMQLTRMRHQLRDYNQQKRQQYEAAMKKEMMSADPCARPSRRHRIDAFKATYRGEF